MRTYEEMSRLSTFEERFRYLQLKGTAGAVTFGNDRFINQRFYRFPEWKRVRDYVIFRDHGCDLGVDGYEIFGKILIHHMNPITLEDIERRSDNLLNPDFLVAVSHNTHNAIHYGDESLLITGPIERRPNDTCPWKK